jgi:NitT/TauT family transport system permease protein
MDTLRRSLPSLVTLIFLLIAWEIAVRTFDIQQFLLPAPSVILTQLVEKSGELWVSAQMALVEALGGLAIGTTLALIAALLAVRFKIARKALIPFAIGLNAVPTLVFAPIMNNWFGSVNPLSKMMVVVTLVYYPVMINAVRGLTQVDAQALELVRSYAATEWEIFWKLRVPNALPYFFNALKLGATLSVIGTVVAGYFGGQRAALGVYILNEVVLFRFPSAWAGIVVACLIGFIFYGVVTLVERLVMSWHVSLREPS